MDKRTKIERLGEEKLNYQGCLMKIVEYNNTLNIIVEFQDEYKARVHTCYAQFRSGSIKNPYCISVYSHGIVGDKCPASINGKSIKEYKAWNDMLRRCYGNIKGEKHKRNYGDVTCCKEWFFYENFYEWLHKQENFNKWLNGERWNLDKDILVKGNKIYSPETCCLVPSNVNNLFTKRNIARGSLPIGVHKNKNKNNKYVAQCQNPFIHKYIVIGEYKTSEEAFQNYKIYKEDIIKQVAQNEYDKGNITKQCYDAMMNYEVEITD